MKPRSNRKVAVEMKEDRTLVIVSNNDGDFMCQILLNDDQIRLLEWLIDTGWLNGDAQNFQELDKTDTPIII